MKNKNKKRIEPKISLIFHEKDGDKQLRPSRRKMKNFLNVSLRNFSKFNVLVTFRVVYGKAIAKSGKLEIFENQLTTRNVDDIQWAFDAFLDPNLWL